MCVVLSFSRRGNVGNPPVPLVKKKVLIYIYNGLGRVGFAQAASKLMYDPSYLTLGFCGIIKEMDDNAQDVK